MESELQKPEADSGFLRFGRIAFRILTGSYFQSIAIGLCFIVLAVYLAFQAGMLGRPDGTIKAGEIDLSGTWKIHFDDRADFRRADLSDKDWCLISVPNSEVRAEVTDPGEMTPAATCPEERYPKSRMRNSTYWYRKKIVIPEEFAWKNPALYLGSIKHQAWIYWDGVLVGSSGSWSPPAHLLLEPGQTRPGNHSLAIRVNTADTNFPGIFHGHRRKVALGEFEEGRKEATWLLQVVLVEPSIVFVTQMAALSLLVFLILRSGKSNESLLWLSIYFGSAATSALIQRLGGDLSWLVQRTSLINMSLALAGFGEQLLSGSKERQSLGRLVTIFVLVLLNLIEAFACYSGNPNLLGAHRLDKIAIFGSMVYLLVRGSIFFCSNLKQSNCDRVALKAIDVFTFVSLLSSHLIHVFDGVVFADFPIFIPFFEGSTLFTPVMTLVVVALAVEDHVNKERQLAFFGRFVRRGLKSLLLDNEKEAINGRKVVRGRRIAIMLVDIVGHTDTTYGMPYGLKRIFQDCWFSCIDEVVASKTFLDRGQGDGSIYYFDEDPSGRTCSLAIEAAERIRDQTLEEFNSAMKARVRQVLREEPELQKPTEVFFQRFQKRTGCSFWDYQVQVRFVLAYGFVDEGLWGMMTRGHYDVQGDILTLIARLEKHAKAGEILMTKDFERQLKDEQFSLADDYRIEDRTADLKGIGVHPYVILFRLPDQNKKTA